MQDPSVAKDPRIVTTRAPIHPRDPFVRPPFLHHRSARGFPRFVGCIDRDAAGVRLHQRPEPGARNGLVYVEDVRVEKRIARGFHEPTGMVAVGEDERDGRHEPNLAHRFG